MLELLAITCQLARSASLLANKVLKSVRVMAPITPIRKAVIPAAGVGTRLLPVTKSLPKELVPILDNPMLQYVIEEAIEAGVEDVIVVSAPGKERIVDYITHDPVLERRLTGSIKPELLDKVLATSQLAKLTFVVQEEALGLGHAVLTAKDAVGDEPFVIILPDDIIHHTPGVITQMKTVTGP